MRGLLSLMFLALLCLGCSEGEDLPLVAPGISLEWPADPGWVVVPEMFIGRQLKEGAWDEDSSVAVLVGSEGGIFENKSDQWSQQDSGLSVALNSVVSLGNGEFLAVGDQGSAMARIGGQWQREETGTTWGLTLVVHDEATAWAVGKRGTVLRRQAGDWTILPPPVAEDLLGVAVLNDSVFVSALNDTGRLRVWDGQSWGIVPSGPWGELRVRGLVTNGDGHLYAAADSLYVRDPAGWRTITDSWFYSFSWDDDLRLKTTGTTIWYGDGGWYRIDPALADWQPRNPVAIAREILAPKNETDYLTTVSDGRITWVEGDEVRLDPAGNPGIWKAVDLAEGGTLVVAETGVYLRDRESRTLVMAPDQLPSLYESGFRAGCGHSPDDYYLLSWTGLYHCLHGVATLLWSWDNWHFSHSLAVTEDDDLYMGDREGLWLWQGASWQRVLPAVPDEKRDFRVWPLGDGSLAAYDEDRYYYVLRDGEWLALGQLRSDAVLLAGADGALLAVQSMSSTMDFEGGNALLVYDKTAAAFRNYWGLGMGALQQLNIVRGTSRGGEVLIQTSNPTMVFTLNGPPSQADWQVVAGPLNAHIEHLERLPGGELLALVSGDQFYIYRP